jgi:hemolysin activation/secretion protein
VGSSGLRANISHIHTDYEIGDSFASLDAYGMARITQLGFSYPVVRSQVANVNLLVNYQYKLLNDVTNSTSTNTNKFSNVMPVALAFDIRDNLHGSAITYGTLTYTRGEVNLDASLLSTDSTTTKSNGYFSKLNIDVARMQYVAPNLNAFLKLAYQRANKNLDSSESFGLGGSDGVRAFPTGEGYGDEGWLTKMELRYNIKDFTPYVFHDFGHVKTNAIPYDNSDNYRTISGAGIGTKFNYKDFSFDTSLAWPISGGRPTSDTKSDHPNLWLTMNYSF